MFNQKAFSVVYVVVGVFLLLIVGIGLFLFPQQKSQNSISASPVPFETPVPSLFPLPSAIPQSSDLNSAVLRESLSPDGKYKITITQPYIQQFLKIEDNTGKVITSDLIEPNWERLFEEMKKQGLLGAGHTGFSVREWRSNTVFVMRIVVAEGTAFVVDVDAEKGEILEGTMRRTQ